MDGTAGYFILLGLFGLLGALVAVAKNLVADLRSDDMETRIGARRVTLKAAMMMAGIVLTTLGGMRIWAEVDLRMGDTGRYATREGSTIRLHPSNITFQIPDSWLGWYAAYHNNLHLNHRELRSVRKGHGEWDTEYGEVVNAVLPFEHCAAHVGGEGWGWEGVSFGDLQVRAYVTDLSVPEILDRIKTRGRAAANEIAHDWQDIQVSNRGEWQHAVITYALWYGDYGGTGVVEFYAKDTGTYRLVLVFMGIGEKGEKSLILSSLHFPQ